MDNFPQNLNKKLHARKESQAWRSLKILENKIDFSSNDYLGLSKNNLIKTQVKSIQKKYSIDHSGATGSRLISGHHEIHHILEKYLAQLFKSESTLLFPSGYMANLGFISTVPQRNDCIIYDGLVHASIRDGIRLSHAKSIKFQHNNMTDFQKKLNKLEGNVYVVVESIYSMDGEEAPLLDLVNLCSQRPNTFIVVDEAHSTGIYGKHGAGLCVQLGIENKIFARIFTFGKAIGYHGACVVGHKKLINFLINFSRPFIYTTAISVDSVLQIYAAFKYIKMYNPQQNLWKMVSLFKTELTTKKIAKKFIFSNSPIQSYLISGNENVKKLEYFLSENNIFAKAILHPTVAKGQERIRICIHAFNTSKEIKTLVKILSKYD